MNEYGTELGIAIVAAYDNYIKSQTIKKSPGRANKMKIQTTKKAIKENFSKIISINYCDAQYLLNCKSPFAYSAGSSGWSCDYYQIGNVCISTGYQPIGERLDYSKVRELETKAQTIVHNYEITYEQREKELDLLISELINM